jgi:ubiquinone/menaquinone biosynthesis C-methylase UbiE
MWSRQEKRGDLAPRYWDLVRGRPGFRVADVGCGAGYFSARYAALTGPTGHVHAVDVDEDSLAYLRSRLDPVHHAHVTTEVLDAERAPLPDIHFHALFCTDVLHHVEDIAAFLQNLRVAKAPLLVAEFDPDGPGDFGPDIEARIAPEDLRTALRDAGFTPAAPVALPHEHYAILALVNGH